MGVPRTFTVGGQRFSVSREDIEQRLKGIPPEPIRQYFVTVNGTNYPVKQAVELTVGLLRSGFTSQDAIRVLRKFGLPLGKSTPQS